MEPVQEVKQEVEDQDREVDDAFFDMVRTNC